MWIKPVLNVKLITVPRTTSNTSDMNRRLGAETVANTTPNPMY
jgi:hypothetical protein